MSKKRKAPEGPSLEEVIAYASALVEATDEAGPKAAYVLLLSAAKDAKRAEDGRLGIGGSEGHPYDAPKLRVGPRSE